MTEKSLKSRVFIGSSAENLHITYELHTQLDRTAEPVTWTGDTFELSNLTLPSLIKIANSVDFAVFIFSPDDISIIRDKEKSIVRDNVLFELGLFIGTIGLERCYIVKPRGIDLHIPSDLSGITMADYDSKRSENEISSALIPACNQIEKSIKQHGKRNQINQSINTNTTNSNLPEFITVFTSIDDLTDLDFQILKVLIPTVTEHKYGIELYRIKMNVENHTEQVDLGMLRLLNLRLIERKIEQFDNHNESYKAYAYNLTQNGINFVFSNEKKCFPPDPNDIPF